MKRFLAVLISALMLVSLVSCSSDEADAKNKKTSDGNIAVIEVENYGTIKVELYPDIAPVTVKNFKKLVNEGFYDGLIFHRVIEGFMIQGGGFDEDDNQKEADTIFGEFDINGHTNTLLHSRGVISMARTGASYDSASSQFFICHQDSNHLDGQYAAFGEVIEGMDVVDSIATVETGADDKPVENVVIKSIHLEEKTESSAAEDSEEPSADYGEVVKAEIEMADGGIIKLDLYPGIAPKTVDNFVTLAKDGFYDGLIFHRVIEGFMIQGGDPEGTGMGGSDNQITGEFSANGIENPLSHKRGVISMARASYSYDSASSQFFICHVNYPSLDGQYAAFGQVTEGMDVVDSIAEVETGENYKPVNDVVIKTVRILDTDLSEDNGVTDATKETEETLIESGTVEMELTDPAVNESLK